MHAHSSHQLLWWGLFPSVSSVGDVVWVLCCLLYEPHHEALNRWGTLVIHFLFFCLHSSLTLASALVLSTLYLSLCIFFFLPFYLWLFSRLSSSLLSSLPPSLIPSPSPLSNPIVCILFSAYQRCPYELFKWQFTLSQLMTQLSVPALHHTQPPQLAAERVNETGY